jgi:hypothetical protein
VIDYHGVEMFEEFSRGYYLGRLYVEPAAGDRPAIQRQLHEHVNRELYADGEGIERLDAPLVMKVGTSHLAVEGDEGVPEGTLAVPEEFIADGARIPSLEEVLLAKADVADRLLAMGAPVGI